MMLEKHFKELAGNAPEDMGKYVGETAILVVGIFEIQCRWIVGKNGLGQS